MKHFIIGSALALLLTSPLLLVAFQPPVSTDPAETVVVEDEDDDFDWGWLGLLGLGGLAGLRRRHDVTRVSTTNR